MSTPAPQLSAQHRAFVDRFVTACQADERVAAAFLSGSYARGEADALSDLDLDLITTDDAYEAFLAGREAFVRQLGELLFLENFGIPGIVFYIFADGTEGELAFGCENDLRSLHSGPYRVLLDKKGILAGAEMPWRLPALEEQRETLRREVTYFWHELSHFITALGRGQLFWAHGQLEALRLKCLNLARLRQDFFDGEVGEESYFKIEKALPVEQLRPFEPTYCPLEPEAMLQAAKVLLSFYQALAKPLAQAHGIPYPAGLERVMVRRMERLPQRQT